MDLALDNFDEKIILNSTNLKNPKPLFPMIHRDNIIVPEGCDCEPEEHFNTAFIGLRVKSISKAAEKIIKKIGYKGSINFAIKEMKKYFNSGNEYCFYFDATVKEG